MFDEELSSCQDWDMWLRIAKDFEFDFVPDVLTRIFVHGQQISTNFAALIPGRTRMVEKHWDEFKEHSEILVIHLKRLGKLHCLNGTWSQAPQWFAKAVEIRPIEIVKIAAWCLVELPFLKLFSNSRKFKRHAQ
ncbi:MAG: hypothetical protein JNN05_07410 [Candidatus Omnitrophica bacterium]|nr:hypothetical protein [Candidatus Omnitrophota bacterium]